jgi:uncharacterized protein YkwD
MTSTRSVYVTGFVVFGLILSQSRAGQPDEATAAALLSAHNREREKLVRRPLKLSASLGLAAARQAGDMAKHQKLDHKGTDGSTVSDRVKSQAYAFVRVAENVAVGQNSVEEVMQSWMGSPGHRANILGDHAEMGGAFCVDADGKRYWCVVFGEPMPRLDPAEAASDVVNVINSDRKARGRPGVRVVPALGKGAMAVCIAMAAKDSLKIDKDPFSVLAAQGVQTHGRELKLTVGTNVPTPEEAVKTLIGDEAEQFDRYQDVGVGYAVAKNGTPYWCAVFSRKASPDRPIARPSGSADR